MGRTQSNTVEQARELGWSEGTRVPAHTWLKTAQEAAQYGWTKDHELSPTEFMDQRQADPDEDAGDAGGGGEPWSAAELAQALKDEREADPDSVEDLALAVETGAEDDELAGHVEAWIDEQGLEEACAGLETIEKVAAARLAFGLEAEDPEAPEAGSAAPQAPEAGPAGSAPPLADRHFRKRREAQERIDRLEAERVECVEAVAEARKAQAEHRTKFVDKANAKREELRETTARIERELRELEAKRRTSHRALYAAGGVMARKDRAEQRLKVIDAEILEAKRDRAALPNPAA